MAHMEKSDQANIWRAFSVRYIDVTIYPQLTLAEASYDLDSVREILNETNRTNDIENGEDRGIE